MEYSTCLCTILWGLIGMVKIQVSDCLCVTLLFVKVEMKKMAEIVRKGMEMKMIPATVKLTHRT